ncbi:hypothetical protein [Gordonia phthalatica]|uniref:hypothetical protein n=1 Tax=Gordonia phthalatica TaxID=1136941 RepID=UPI0012FEA594|nr:hypothetical protein [Gordonia phthalatica]
MFESDTHEREALELEFADWAAARTAEERAAVARWQGPDRFYQRVQSPAEHDFEAQDVRDAIIDLATSHVMSADRRLWRGIRSCQSTFGVDAASLENVVGDAATTDRLTAATPLRVVAESEFSKPALDGGGALLCIVARKGTPAAFLATVGRRDMAYQCEVVFPPGLRMRMLRVDRSVLIPVVVVEFQRRSR